MADQLPPALARAKLPASLLEVLRVLDRAGHRSWLVGGAVRDLLLHRPRAATDLDVATPARPEEVVRLFPRVVPTGIEHGTVTVLIDSEKVEVTTFRGEGAYLDGRRPESVTFLTDLKADLARRDFTMNALAYDPIGRQFCDPFGGRDDLRRRLIRAVGDPAARFGEDGLRPLRAVRFAAQLGYEVEKGTLDAIPGALAVTHRVSIERVAEELSRLLAASHAAEGLALLRSTGLLAIALPRLGRLPEERLAHSFRAVGRVGPEPVLRFAALLHLLPPQEAGGAIAALRLPSKLAEDVVALLSRHRCPADDPLEIPADAPALRRWLARVGPDRVGPLLELARADAESLPGEQTGRALAAQQALEARAREELAKEPPLTLADLALDGRAAMRILNSPPGRRVGEALQHLLDRVLEEPPLNTPEKLAQELLLWTKKQGDDGGR